MAPPPPSTPRRPRCERGHLLSEATTVVLPNDDLGCRACQALAPPALFMTTAGAAAVLGLSPSRVLHLLAAGQLGQPIRAGLGYQLERAAVERLAAERARAAERPRTAGLPPLPPERPEEPPRLQLARRVRAMREQGLLYREIASALGVSKAYVSGLLRDPTGEQQRARHDRQRGTCATCGGPTTWWAGGRRPTHCWDCSPAFIKAPCGTISAYRRGCRCAACRAANAAAQRRWQAARRAAKAAA
jgi:hypothetical protein